MSVGNKVLVFRWFEEVWNKKNEAVIDELLAPESLLFGISSVSLAPLKGPAAFKTFWRQIILAFPDVHFSVEATLAEDDKVAVRCSIRGTNRGPFYGRPATGKKMDIMGSSMATVIQGRIVESWNNFDFLRLYQQLGFIPPLSAIPTPLEKS